MTRAKTRTNVKTTGTIPDRKGGVRLQKYLAAAGVASRRAAERLICEGSVEVNGRVVTRLGTCVSPGRDAIRVEGRRIHSLRRYLYYLLNKPKGYLATVSDPRGRPTVLDLLPGVRERVYPVGRLDWSSEGLLIITNDGALAYHLTHPRNHVSKIYRVKVKGTLSGSALGKLRRGVMLDGRRTLPARATRIASRTNTWLQMTIFEGRKNQIRRVCEKLGHPVLKLRRVAIGAVADPSLKPGQYRTLTEEEVKRLYGGKG